MVKIRTIEVFSKEIRVILNKEKDNDYISLTDMVKGSEGEDHIRNWMRNKNTIEFLGIWEQLHNPNFKGAEFDTFWHEAGLNRFNMTPKKWIEGTNAIGIVSKSGRGGGTYAHKDIAFNFGMYTKGTVLRLKIEVWRCNPFVYCHFDSLTDICWGRMLGE